MGSATLNTSQQVGGSIGTALLNTLAAGAATAYLVGKVVSPGEPQDGRTAQLHDGVPVVVHHLRDRRVVAGLVLKPGNLRQLASGPSQAPTEAAG